MLDKVVAWLFDHEARCPVCRLFGFAIVLSTMWVLTLLSLAWLA